MQDILLSNIPLQDLKTAIGEIFDLKIKEHFAKPISKPENDLITRKEAAKILKVSLPTILDWTKSGKIIGYRVSSRVRYKKSEIEASVKQIRIK